MQELDPPPWLHRMRELGYPPGYLGKFLMDQTVKWLSSSLCHHCIYHHFHEMKDIFVHDLVVSAFCLYLLAVEDDHHSGITIYGEEESKEEEEEVKAEEGEILEKASSPQEPERKMTVEFPGINAPIPDNADLWLWQQRSNTGHDQNLRPRDYREEMGPPGVVELSSSYPPRYGIIYDHGFGSRTRSPGSENSEFERVKRLYYSSYDPDFRERDDSDPFRFSSRR